MLYELFPTRDAMDAAFQLSADARQAPEADCSTEHLAVSSYAIDGERAGRILCYTIEPGRFGKVGGRAGPVAPRVDTGERPDLCARRQERPRRSEPLPVVAVLGGADRPCRERSLPLREGPSRIVRVGPARWVVPVRAHGRRSRIPRRSRAYRGSPTRSTSTEATIWPPSSATSTSAARPISASRTPSCSHPRPASEAGPASSVRSSTRGRRPVGGCPGRRWAAERAPGLNSPPSDPWTRAPAGQIAIESGNDIALMDAGGFVERKPTDQHETDPNVWPDWSPDGSRIVFAGASQEGYDLYTMAPDGTGAERITHEPGDEIMPSWSPDGTRIAFAFDDLGEPDFETGIVVVGTSGEARAEVVTRQNELVESPIWSPDGTRIAFTVFSENGDRPVAYVMDPDGGDLVEVREEAVALSWTPDGKRIVLSAYGSLLAVRPDGTGDRVILRYPPENGRLVLDWSPDGRWIVMTNPYRLGDQRVPDAVRRRRAVPRGERLGTVMASGIRLTSGGDDVRTDAPDVPDGVATSAEISLEELQLSQRNHGMQLEGLRYDVTPAGMHYLLIHFDVPEADEATWRSRSAGSCGPARALDGRPPIAAERHDAGDDGVRRQRPGATRAAADLAAVAHRGDRDRRVDRHPAAADPRGGRDRGRRRRARVPRRRSRDPGRRRAGLRAQPVDRGRDAGRGAPRVRDERRSAAPAARVPAPARGAGLVRDDEREVAHGDRGRAPNPSAGSRWSPTASVSSRRTRASRSPA